jgi:predicted nucleic acid-binding protein
MTIDANILIAYLAGDGAVIQALTRWRRDGMPLFLSTVAEAEVLSFSEWTLQERHDTEKWIEENFTSLSFDRQVARVAADLRRNYKIKFPDAAIAATAWYTNSPLVTRNQRDFKHIGGLQIIAL